MFYQISKYNVDITEYVTTNRLLYWRPRKYSGKGCQKIHLDDPSVLRQAPSYLQSSWHYLPKFILTKCSFKNPHISLAKLFQCLAGEFPPHLAYV